jgi:ABC-type glutathione transport system ATPase component
MASRTPNQELLRVEKASVAFRRPKGIVQEVLTDVSFTVNSCEVAVIIGDSGSGKSTPLNFVAGFLRPNIRREGSAIG